MIKDGKAMVDYEYGLKAWKEWEAGAGAAAGTSSS
jgi:hypothetical protein